MIKLSEEFDDLDDLMEEASKVEAKDTSITTIAKENKSLEYTINENDDIFKVALKNLINSMNITMQDLYDKKGQQDGYNMKYALDKAQLGFNRFLEWCDFLHVKVNISFSKMSDEEAKEADLRMLNKKKMKKPK